MEFPGLERLYLKSGGHDGPEQGACLMEAVAWMRGVEWTDHPACVCDVLGGMGRALNDQLSDEMRQKLVPLIPSLIGTADDGLAERRGLMATDWIVRTYTPTWLRLAKLEEEAAALEQLPEIVDTETMKASLAALNRARERAAAARDAARAAARDAAGAAARDAAWDAARAAAWDAARAAAGAAARDAAWDAARAAAWDAARAAAGAAARAAAGAAARDAAWAAARDAARAAARAAAGAAAWAALSSTVEQLQLSAIDLYRRMAELRPAAVAA